MSELLIVACHNHIAHIKLNRSASRNALSHMLVQHLSSCIDDIAQDMSIRAVIISGEGDKAFCAGADLKERQSMSDAQVQSFLLLIQSTLQKLSTLPMPTIAAINGDAFGGGLELALACDMRIAGDHARMGLVECSLGIIPGAGGTQRLPRIIGLAQAYELIFTAQKLDCAQALRLGLINHAVPAHELLACAFSQAQAIARNAPLAVRAAKKAIKYCEGDLAAGLAAELEAYREILATQDRKEGLCAFAEKRPPHFNGS